MLIFQTIFSSHCLNCLDLSFGIAQLGWIVKLLDTIYHLELIVEEMLQLLWMIAMIVLSLS